MNLSPLPTDALLVIDLQNDFCPGGALAVDRGDEVVPTINALAQKFDHVILTQDWHPPHHISFATTHDRQPYETIEVPYGPQNIIQTLWPDHCLQHTEGAAFHPDLSIPHAELILRKGFRRHIDSYSAFCVRYSAIDGKALGFEAIVIEDATRPVNLPNSVAETNAAFAAADIHRIQSTDIDLIIS